MLGRVLERGPGSTDYEHLQHRRHLIPIVTHHVHGESLPTTHYRDYFAHRFTRT